jgi:tetratricopeptide (TPR) repeat protein
MSLILAFLLTSASGIDPEIEAVMGRRKAPAERRTRAAEGPAIDPALDQCADLARRDPAAALASARHWAAQTDGPLARQCLGLAHAQSKDWTNAAADFRDGARLAGTDKATAARLWAQAGNASLAGGDMAAALSALDQASLDRARVRVAMDDEAGARSDLDTAVRLAPQDPLVWLLSATLARRMNDLPLAKKHIAEAVARADDDASVALEQGVIAALDHDDAAAIAAFRKARSVGTDPVVVEKAEQYLVQFGDTASAATPTDTSKKPQSR